MLRPRRPKMLLSDRLVQLLNDFLLRADNLAVLIILKLKQIPLFLHSVQLLPHHSVRLLNQVVRVLVDHLQGVSFLAHLIQSHL